MPSHNAYMRRLWMTGVFLIVLGSLIYGLTKSPQPASQDVIYVSVEPGMTARNIGDQLYAQGLIQDVFSFRVIAKVKGLDNSLKAGDYSFTANLPLTEIVDKLAQGKTDKQQFTIPEGYTVDQIAALIEKEQMGSAERFKAAARSYQPYVYMENPLAETMYAAEGFLFPDTYQFDKGMTEEQLLAMMVDEFNRRFSSEMRLRTEALGLSAYQLITMASLVEKEAQLASDRPIIAGVFLHRLLLEMPLQSCATIQYILGYPKPELTIQDTKIESPYNTYQYGGLPPGPIANPGMAAIEAVLSPETTNYLYFVADQQGRHHFSATYEEHLAAIEKVQSYAN